MIASRDGGPPPSTDLREVYFSPDPIVLAARRLDEARGTAPTAPRTYAEVRAAVLYPEDAGGLVEILRRERRTR